MSTMKAGFWEKQAVRKTLARFRQIAERVPAYRKVLEEQRINPDDIKTMADYAKLPILDKKHYLNRFPLEQLCHDGKLSDKYLIDRSSGYSGTSFFWPRLTEEDRDYPTYMNLAYEQFYQIDRKSTLMIITLALGTWVGGEKISWATRQIALSGKHPFTVITPGANIDEILEIVDFFKSKYDQIVIVGYPPLVKTVIDTGKERGIDWKGFKLKIGLGGEGYSEDWREYVRREIGGDEKDLMGIAGGYGAADLGMSVGREYPITVLIRKLANKNKALARDLFGENGIPSLCQYNPATFFIEGINNELIFSCLAGVPLVRYNIHDRGGVIPFERALEIVRSHGFDPLKLLAEYGYTKRDIWRLPFFFVNGRSDGTVIIDGTNVYPENVGSMLSSPEGQLVNSYRLEVKQDEQFNERLYVHLELRSGKSSLTGAAHADLIDKLQEQIVQAICSENQDYRDAYRINPAVCKPKVTISEYSQGLFHGSENDIKRRYVTEHK